MRIALLWVATWAFVPANTAAAQEPLLEPVPAIEPAQDLEPAATTRVARPEQGIATFATVNGRGGLIATSTASVLPTGLVDTGAYFVGALHSNVPGVPGGLPRREFDLKLAAHWGAYKDVDVGIVVPIGLYAGLEKSFGLRSTQLSARYLVYHPEAGRYAAAFTGYLGLPSPQDSFGDQQLSGGIEGSVTLRVDRAGRVTTGVNLGVDRGDYTRKQDGTRYNSVFRVLGSANLAYRIDDAVLVSAELYGLDAFAPKTFESGLLPGDEDAHFSLGGRYALSNLFDVSLALGIGLPGTDRPETNYSLIAGASYNFQARL